MLNKNKKYNEDNTNGVGGDTKSHHVRSSGLETPMLIGEKWERSTPLIVVGPDYNGLD